MQIMEGDVIATINKYKDTIGHYHTGGVPGRNELDATQELNWPAVDRSDHRHRLQGLLRARVHPEARSDDLLGEAVTLCDV